MHLSKDRIEVDERAIEVVEQVYLMMNKPRGVVTTASDEKGRQTVYAYLEVGLPWVAPVGRLDKASEGLLLLTNDSEWADKMTAPETHLEKTYHVQVGVVANTGLLEAMARGIKSDDEVLRVKRARILRGGDKNTWLEVVLDEGKNRQIRRILENLSVEVLRLVRVGIGPLVLGELTKGSVRPLSEEEKRAVARVLARA